MEKKRIQYQHFVIVWSLEIKKKLILVFHIENFFVGKFDNEK